jgi:hypothetical protein
MQKITTALLTLVALAGCVPQHSAYEPPPPGVEWARKDGQRMSANPALIEKGLEDKTFFLCFEVKASNNGAVMHNSASRAGSWLTRTFD